MSSLFSALNNAAESLDVLQQAMSVVQNNVTNANTPGYVTQSLTLNSRAFQPSNDLWGGVQSGGVQSSRNLFAEENVWNQNELLGAASQQASSLSSLQSIFGVSGTSGIPAALSSLYSAFSAWSTSPNDTLSQQGVLNAAQSFAQAFNQASLGVNQLSTATDQQLQSTVTQVNQLTSEIANLNAQIKGGDTNDAGLQANLYNDLEQLSNLVSINVQTASDGSVTVLMNGQAPLVIGAAGTQLQIIYEGSAGPPPPSFPGGSMPAHIVTADGQDVTSIVNTGQLAAVLQFRNVTLPSVMGSQTQQGSLNQLAQAVADKVNSLLTSGQTNAGNPGIPLFSYASGGSVLAGNSQVLTGSGAVFVKGTAGTNDQKFTFHYISPTTGNATSLTATVSASANGSTLDQVLSSLNNQLSGTGITAGVDSDGHLQFSGSTAFTVSDGGTANVANPLTNYTGSALPNKGTADNASNYVVDGASTYNAPATGETETLTFTTASGSTVKANLTNAVGVGDTLANAIATINAQTASQGIYAVANANGTGISFQSSSTFAITDQQTGGGSAAPAVFGNANTTAATYNPVAPSLTDAAGTLTVNNITGSQLAAVETGASGSANGIASQLANLENNTADMPGNMTFTNFYSSVASDIGTQEANATTAKQSQTQLLSQAQNARAQVSGVSLNDQAAQLLQFQQAYEASSEMIQVINSMNQYFMQVMQGA